MYSTANIVTMKQELTTQEDWLVEHNIAVQEPNRELWLTLPLFKEQEPRVDLSCNAITRQRLQQQLGKPDSVNNSLDSAHRSGNHARSGDQEKIAEHKLVGSLMASEQKMGFAG